MSELRLFQRHVKVNGLNLHIADRIPDKGTDLESLPPVLFLHGIPEIWYSWRYQMEAVAKAGHRAITPDYRGYGESEVPCEPEKTTFEDFMKDLIGILDHFEFPKVYVIGKDSGSIVAHRFALLHPERVIALLAMNVPYLPPDGHTKLYDIIPEGFYLRRWREPGRAEADFGRFDPRTVVKKIYIMFSKEHVPVAEKDEEILDLIKDDEELPDYFSQDDLERYGKCYQKTGFQTLLQVPYRSMDERVDMEDLTIKVPTVLIMGSKDCVYNFPGIKEYLEGEELKRLVPGIKIIFVPEGSHFLHVQFPEQTNELVLDFLKTHQPCP